VMGEFFGVSGFSANMTVISVTKQESAFEA
jgi:hypothetical protein